MSAVTQCPQCATRFRVVPDQLKISQGWVRCGKCGEVFDARKALMGAATPPADVSSGVASAPAAHRGTVPAPSQVSIVLRQPPATADDGPSAPAPAPADPAPAFSMPAAPPAAGASAGVERAIGPAQDAPAVAAEDGPPENPPQPPTQPPTSPTAPALAPDAAAVPISEPIPVPTPALAPEPEPEPEPALQPEPEPASPPVSPVAPPVAGDAWVGERVAPPPPPPRAPAVAPVEALTTVPVEAPTDAPVTPVGFIRKARRQALWQRRGVRAALFGLALGLVVLLAAQLLWRHHDRWAAAHPQWAPVLAVGCMPLGCRLEPPLQIESVAIVGTELIRIKDGTYRLDMVLRNQATHPVATPAVELSLTRRDGDAAVRRVILATEWSQPTPVLPPQAETRLTLRLSLHQPEALRMEGFRALVFYP